LRNAGVGLVIATGTFAGTPAVTAVLVYGFFGVVGSLLLALGWGRSTGATMPDRGESKHQHCPVEPITKVTESQGGAAGVKRTSA
jgi:hypothetical protein